MHKIQEALIVPGMRILVRCDLDVPVYKGEIQEKYRLDSSLETLNYIVNKGAVPVIAGHIGKPDGTIIPELSTKQLLPYFTEKLGEGKFEILENLRFAAGEEENDQNYARDLSLKAAMYVNESFATSHRKHASIVSVPKILPHYAGFRFQKEIEMLGLLIKSPKRPFVSIVGGSKLESKMPVITKLLNISDKVLLGGKVALSWNQDTPSNLILPTDSIDDKDIGQKTIQIFKETLSSAKTVFWAGPLGMYEETKYYQGTGEIARHISELTKSNSLISVVGGGDTVAAIQKSLPISSFTFASTGGGASLQYLVDETLPGIEALN